MCGRGAVRATRTAPSLHETRLVADGRGAERAPRSPARAASVVVPFPRTRFVSGIDVDRVLPSGRSLLTAFALVVAAVAGYFVARDTSVFAVSSIDVRGAPPGVSQQVRRALRDDLGRSLLRLNMNDVQRRVAALPTVASAQFDRAFPHTLRITVVPERSVAVVRQGALSWLVSANGRVMAGVEHGARRRLPRIWITKDVAALEVGGTVPTVLDGALAAVSPLGSIRFPARVTSARATDGELTLVLRSGIEVRLGAAVDVPLKLAVVAKVLPLVAADTRYVDVSVPERPVAGTVERPQSMSTAVDQTLKSQLELDSLPSTSP
jgi:cell division protein FtsQ